MRQLIYRVQSLPFRPWVTAIHWPLPVKLWITDRYGPIVQVQNVAILIGIGTVKHRQQPLVHGFQPLIQIRGLRHGQSLRQPRGIDHVAHLYGQVRCIVFASNTGTVVCLAKSALLFDQPLLRANADCVFPFDGGPVPIAVFVVQWICRIVECFAIDIGQVRFVDGVRPAKVLVVSHTRKR